MFICNFRPKTPPVSTISCHAIDGSPVKPETLKEWESQPLPQYDHQVCHKLKIATAIYLLWDLLKFIYKGDILHSS